MAASLNSYRTVDMFVDQLIRALTEPARADVIETLDTLASIPPGTALTPEILGILGKQQLEMLDSGIPLAEFHERVDNLTHAEGAAIFTFFEAMREAHGEDFPSGEIEKAIERHWFRYRA
jgi:hypothetical protein